MTIGAMDRRRTVLDKGSMSAGMPHLFQPRGEAALAAVLGRSPLLAFDFDGTLAPIVRRPDQARVLPSISGRLRRLATWLPVAVVSGRSTADLKGRLDFEPHYLVGNHGAEMEPHAADRAAPELDAVRALLQSRAGELEAAGVAVEDKGLSLALHYRLARRPDQALAIIRDTVRAAGCPCRTFPGKMVVNVVPAHAPDKAGAMLRLVRECGATCAVFVGDDVNDEPVFAAAPEDWLTIRIGREDRASRAAFFLDHPGELALVLDRMLLLLQARSRLLAFERRH